MGDFGAEASKGKQLDVSSGSLPTKVGASAAIFCISLFAVSFPSLSKRVKYIRIPSVVFFLGKHFGTGVILSTAFVHLLADAFKSLNSEWTGLIVLVSLLAIFIVEYISTAYVDRLHSYPSNPSTPAPSRTPSYSRSPSLSISRAADELHLYYDTNKQYSPAVESIHIDENPESRVEQCDAETFPLASGSPRKYGTDMPAQEVSTVVAFPQKPRASLPAEVTDSAPQSQQQLKLLQTNDSQRTCCCKATIVLSTEVSKDDSIFGGRHHRHESRTEHASHMCRGNRKIAAVVLLEDSEGEVPEGEEPAKCARGGDERPQSKCTLSHMREHEHQHGHGHGFRHGHGHSHSHLDLERWGSGRGAGQEEGEADPLLHHDHHAGHISHEEEMSIGRRRQIVGILMLQIGIMLHSLVIGLTLAITTGPEFTTLVTAILFHQLFEGLSLGIRIAALPSSSHLPNPSPSHVSLFKPALAASFALTTPLGIAAGLLAFSSHSHSHPSERLKQGQGVMSAASAGMLIYAACVEMLAGDFVMDPLMWRSGVRRQAMAVVSLVAGVCAMALVGIWD